MLSQHFARGGEQRSPHHQHSYSSSDSSSVRSSVKPKPDHNPHCTTTNVRLERSAEPPRHNSRQKSFDTGGLKLVIFSSHQHRGCPAITQVLTRWTRKMRQ